MRSKQSWLNFFRTVGQFISTTVIAFITMVAILLVGVRIAGLEMLSVETGSMSPVYPENTLVFVKKVDPATIKVKDVITYVLNSDGVLVTHRVEEIDTQNRQFYTKGDANNSRDPKPVLWDNTVGKVVLGIPKLGGPIRLLNNKESRPKVIAVLAVIGVGSLLWDILGGALEKKKKRENPELDGLSTTETSSEIPAPEQNSENKEIYNTSERKKEDVIYKY